MAGARGKETVGGEGEGPREDDRVVRCVRRWRAAAGADTVGCPRLPAPRTKQTGPGLPIAVSRIGRENLGLGFRRPSRPAAACHTGKFGPRGILAPPDHKLVGYSHDDGRDESDPSGPQTSGAKSFSSIREDDKWPGDSSFINHKTTPNPFLSLIFLIEHCLMFLLAGWNLAI